MRDSSHSSGQRERLVLPSLLLWLALYVLLPRLVHFLTVKPDFGNTCCREVEQLLTEYAVLAGETPVPLSRVQCSQ